jgi:UDP-2-acetamido-2,6-beta-L-arabino-hexul-4-ose reductase
MVPVFEITGTGDRTRITTSIKKTYDMQQHTATNSRRVLVTGQEGMIARNLLVSLEERMAFAGSRRGSIENPAGMHLQLAEADAVVHIRTAATKTDKALQAEQALVEAILREQTERDRILPVVTVHAGRSPHDNASTQAASSPLEALAQRTGHPVVAFQLTEVFGKWCAEDESSIVADYCRSVVKGLPVRPDDPSKLLELIFVEDVVSAIIASLEAPVQGLSKGVASPVYTVGAGALLEQIRAFEKCRVSNFRVERVGWGLVRALYSTYVSYQAKDRFGYRLPGHRDPRGVFVEILKSPDSGQFSYFTINPGFARGGHYHHTMTEKILVVKGTAVVRLRHLLTGELVEIPTSGDRPEVVDTIPGWAHEINNIGTDELVVMLWANEIYDPAHPDTIPSKV